MKKSFTWRSILSMILALILCVSLPVTIWAETTEIPGTPVDNGNGTTTVTNTTIETDYSNDGNGTVVDLKVTVTDFTTTDENGFTLEKGGSETGKEVTTTTTTEPGTPSTDSLYAGSIEVSFDENPTGSGSASLELPAAPENAENVETEDGKISWVVKTEGETLPGEGDGTDVDGDGIIDTVTTKTDVTESTTVEVTDRTVKAELELDEAPQTTEGSVKSPVEGIGGVTLPEGEAWTELDADTQAKLSKITDQLCFDAEADAAGAAATQLVLKALLNGEELPEDTDAAVLSAAKALLEAANAENEAPAEPVIPTVTIENVSLTVNDKTADETYAEANTDDNDTNDVYDTVVKFDIFITESFNGLPLVCVKQNGVTIAPPVSIASASDVVTINEDGSYTVNIPNLPLQEGVDVDLEVTLNGVAEIKENNLFVHTSTFEQPIEQDDQHIDTPSSSHEGNDKGNNGGETSQGHQLIADTNSWSEGDYDENFTVGEGKLNIKSLGGDEKDELVQITVSESIKADFIVIKAANGYLKFDIPGGVLYAGVAYTVQNQFNETIGKSGGISHVCVYGSGDPVETPTETVTTSILGVSTATTTVSIETGFGLNFIVDEASKTTTTDKTTVTLKTRTWEDSWSETFEPTPVPTPSQTPPAQTVQPTPTPTPVIVSEQPTPTPSSITSEEIMLLDDDVPLNEEPEEEEEDYEEEEEIVIEDEDVPLAEVPETGDVSDIMMLVVIFSVIGLIVVNLPMKKRFNA